MLFNKFVPSYHHHFGHQCRVSDYGFTKLIELFEAIPDVVKIEEVNGGERQISLTEKEGLKVLSEQIVKLVTRARGGLSVSSITRTFLHQFGYALRPELFGCSTMLQLVQKLSDTVQVMQCRNIADLVCDVLINLTTDGNCLGLSSIADHRSGYGACYHHNRQITSATNDPPVPAHFNGTISIQNARQRICSTVFTVLLETM